MEIVWTGAMERQAAEAARIYASAIPRQTSSLNERVLAWLRVNGESTSNEIALGLPAEPTGVNTALYNLRHAGLIEATGRTVRTDYGRQAKCYRVREGA